MKTKKLVAVAAALPLLAGLSGCVANESGKDAGSSDLIKVSIKDDSCKVSANEVPSGKVNFELKNEGTAPNEFEILADDKLRIVSERENLGPGTTVKHTVVLEPGKYFTACKKNMVGALVGTAEFTVKDSGKKVEVDANAEKAIKDYTAYVRDQTGQLLDATKNFSKVYLSGNVEEAKKLYPKARMHYERIEPTAEAFGDIDPALDEREHDYQEADDKGKREWTGWHVIEKDLWTDKHLSDADKKKFADKLVKDTQDLYNKVYDKNFKLTLDAISNGAIALLEEVAISKISGEEEAFSHTDLWDFQANVEGAKVAFGNVKDIAAKSDPELVKEIQHQFDLMDKELAKYKEGDGYVTYDKLDKKQRQELADRVKALRVPLAKLTHAVLKPKK